MKRYHSIIIGVFCFLTSNLIAQQFIDDTFLHDGKDREYRLYIPENYDAITPLPLLFNFHGGGGNIASQIAVSDMRSIADTANFFIVYPQALEDPNDGGSTNWIHKDPTTHDDVFLIEKIIEVISAQYSVDRQRVYACGYSLGGEFSYELACRLSHEIAAVGVVARTMNTSTFDNCNPEHPTGILTILGTEDFISPYEGLFWNGTQYYLSADEMHMYWVEFNNTDHQPIIDQIPDTDQGDGSTVERHIWDNGDACVSVEHLKVLGGGHDWPGNFGNMDIDANVEIWNFVSRYNIEGLIGCETLSLENELKNEPLVSYPNPSSNFITISSYDNDIQSYEILSPAGNIIKTGITNQISNTISIYDLSPNLYFLKVGDRISKFIKI